MRLIKLFIVFCLISSVSGLAQSNKADDGSGVGGGNFGPHQDHIEKLKKELGVIDGKKIVGSSHLYKWCSRIGMVLQREYDRASHKLGSNPQEAKDLLKTALIAASQSLDMKPEMGSPMTKRLIDQGVIYIDAMEEAFQNDPASYTPMSSSLITMLHFLFEYVEFVIRVSRTFDRDWFIPYHHQFPHYNRFPQHFKFSEFIEKYSHIAQQQLYFLIKNFLRIVILDEDGKHVQTYVNNNFRHIRDSEILKKYIKHYNERRFYYSKLHRECEPKYNSHSCRYHASYYINFIPRGRMDGVLRLIELSSAFIAEDMGVLLDSYQNTESILRLTDLSDKLHAFNKQMDRTIYSNHHVAFRESMIELLSIYFYPTNHFLPFFHCPNPPHHSMINIIRRPLTLTSCHDIVSIPLPRKMKVDRIYVDAISFSKNTSIDISVREKQHWLVHLSPTKNLSEPIYINTVANSINLRLSSGKKVRINKILVEGY